jgi:16S rRNA C1402 (ribose-2'-O) methylase RsmI
VERFKTLVFTLYVATPIRQFKATLRALSNKGVDAIAAEDTRHTSDYCHIYQQKINRGA